MTDADLEALRRIRERTEQAENDGVAAFFDEVSAADMVLMPPNVPAVAGRAAVVEFMHGFLEQFQLRIRYQSDEMVIHHGFAFDRGRYSQVLTPKGGGNPVPESGKYLWIYTRAADGEWKFSRVIWNADGGRNG
jgi:ketosteroid isomerase-like protein